MANLQTIVFYSYKGGVGRTLALASMAKYLAREGKKTFLIDFDLEAPGLHYKLRMKDEVSGGMVDLLHDFATDQKNPGQRLPELVLEPHFIEQDEGLWPGFVPMRLLAAGNPRDPGYWQRLARLNWHDIFYGPAHWGVPFFIELKEIIRKQYNPDFLLIDARTGVTEMGGAVLTLMADRAVCLFVNNEENIEGIRSIMRGVRATMRPPGAELIGVVPVVTRIPEKMASEDTLIADLRIKFNEPTKNLASTLNINEIFLLHAHPSLELNEFHKDKLNIPSDSALGMDLEKLFRFLSPEPSVPPDRPLRWLHLSDLHMGAPGRSLWWQIHQEFKKSILEEVAREGPPDVIFITGDLTWRGQPEEFQFLDHFLKELSGWLRTPDHPDPLILPVPGNHDLVRPKGMASLPYAILKEFDKGRDHPAIAILLDTLWKEKDATYFVPLFKNYQDWLERSILPPLRQRGIAFTTSHFPGDLLVHLDLPGKIPLSVVGLNSAWLALDDAVQGQLEVATEQLHTLLAPGPGGESPLSILEDRAALLLMHHPPAWLSEAAQGRFRETLYTPERFLACLHGHMHKNRSETIAVSGGKPRYYLQGASLFGLEQFGTRNETRLMGYAWGTLQPDKTIRLWPRKREVTGNGEALFLHDVSFGPENPDGIPVRAWTPGVVPPRETIDIAPWLRSLLGQIDHIDIKGISSKEGRGQHANRYPIERLFTTLRSRGDTTAGHLSLADLFPRHRLLLLEGQPGAGKSTFLKLAATMLARDALGMECPDSTSWRKRFLGMEESGPPPLPLLLRLSDLALFLAKEATSSPNDRFRLLDLLDRTTDAVQEWRNDWEQKLTDGQVVLLLDGLDEVDSDPLRERVFAIVQNALLHWDKTRIVVTSRPFGVELMRSMDFFHGVIEPFGQEEIQDFLDRWIACFYGLPIGEPPGGEAGRYGDQLGKAILDRPTIRRLATNPVMLTCLCVVHWNEGQLPEGRSRVYMAVIRWLIASRKSLREKAGFNDGFAERAMVALAYAMMGGDRGKRKQAVWDWDDALKAIDPIMLRDFPGLSGEERRHKGRAWLHFECLNSGIIEEVGRGRLRFWHLTFQEFMAARHLSWMEETAAWSMIKPRLDNLQWWETIDLLPGCLLDGGQGPMDRLLGWVLTLHGPSPSLADNARIAGIMGRLLAPTLVLNYPPPRDIEKKYRELLEQAMAIFTRDGAAKVPIETRITAAEALGRGGDPRLNREQLIEVPGTGWKLGKYLVTVQEFQQFVEQGGYEEPRWWNKAWTIRQKNSWTSPEDCDTQTEHPNRPVTGVSWFEAMAYCRWLSAQRGKTIRLPCEKLWETAATPLQGGKYPWGNTEPTPELANFGRNVGRPTPVGLYPAGDGPLGHCDLLGNVWEWCRNLDTNNEQPIHATPLDPQTITEGDRLGVRGGSWRRPAFLLRVGFRDGRLAGYRGVNLGFRLAAPASR
ncbi:MAG: SUMF1/EgtB/PvdO family nonheme iron enzyme [Magnetococcales bacterium]|nr:SUMF1/EgtB/PvdO family nonheme iron enzyme [Magnetococcales bacterium]